jgi:hypothetical protein
MTINFPRWVWILAVLVLVIILCVVFKVNLTGHVGSGGIGVDLTQGLVN